MALEDELQLPNTIANPRHGAIVGMVLTGAMLSKEGDRLFRPFGLTESQFNILMLLKHQSEGGRINQTQLGQMLLVNRSNITGLVDRMEQAGWVERRAEEGDRRVKMVQLTANGRRLLEKAEKAYYTRIEYLLSDVSPAELKQLSRILERVRARIGPPTEA